MSHNDERAVTVLIGALFLALILVLLTTVLQTQAVPNWNRGVEFDHNQDVQNDLVTLRDSIIDASADGHPRAITVTLGTDYPNRVVLQNPADPVGTLAMRETSTLVIGNATSSGTAAEVWDGADRSFTTRGLVYEPTYNRYINAPTTAYDSGVLYNDFESDQGTITGQQLVQDNRIGLILLDGEIARTQKRPVTVEVTPVSSPAQTVAVTNTSDPIVLEIPTQLSNETWADLLEDEYASNGGHIVDQDYQTGSPYNVLELTLERGVTYELALSKVAVGHGVPEVDPYYLSVSGEDVRVTDEDERTKLEFVARDRYDNPVSNAPVVLTAPTGRFEDEAGIQVTFPLRTNDDGVATVWYDADGNIGMHEVSAYLNWTADDTLPERKQHDIEVVNTGGAGTDASGLVEQTGSVNLLDVNVELTFDNRAGQPINLTGIRLVDVSKVKKGGDGVLIDEHTQVMDTADEITDVASGIESESVTAAEGEGPVFFGDPIELPAGSTTLTLTFDSNIELNTDDALDLRIVLYYDHGLRSDYAVYVNLL